MPLAQAPLPDNACRVRIGRGRHAAADTEEVIWIRPISIIYQTAAETFPTGVARVAIPWLSRH